MDPLSATLAVITLVTAVKDIVELGQKIHESFAMVSKNLRKAQLMAESIKEMVEEIQVFCDDHKDVLANMKEFLPALRGLLGKFRNFEMSILPLLPKTGRSKFALFLRGWLNNNKIQESVSDLESDVVKVMRRYMMKSTMRIEIKQETNHQEIRRGLTDVHHDITQGLEDLGVVRRRVSIIAASMTHRLNESSGTTGDEFDRSIIMFAQSTASASAPILRTPNVITDELMTTAYIKFQLSAIAMSVEKMTLPASATNNISLNSIASFRLSAPTQPISITHLRYHVVRQVIDIRDLLETTRDVCAISIYHGANALNELLIGLDTLGMGHESMLVGKWAIALARTLVASSSSQPEHSATLALHLFSQSKTYFHNGDKIQSLQLITEAYTIAQNLSNHYGGEVHFQILYSKVLLQYSRLVDNQQSIKMSIEAVQVLEGFLNVQAFAHSESEPHAKIGSVVQPSSSFFSHLLSSAPPVSAITAYAQVLSQLGAYLIEDGYSESALGLLLLSVAVYQKIVSIHGHEHKEELALKLASLVKGRAAEHIAPEKLVVMAEECVQLFRELAENNPLYYAKQLVQVLYVKAFSLESLGQDTEAVATWEEAARLAGRIIQDSSLHAEVLINLSNQFRRLNRHDDAVRTGTLAINTYHDEAEYQVGKYFYLSKDLQQLRRYKESADAAQTSVTLFRCLAMKDPGTWMSSLLVGLSHLSHCLAILGDYSEALIAWKESVSMIDSFSKTTPDVTSDVIDYYLAALDIHTYISYALEDEKESLKVSFTAAQYLHRLSEIYPPDADIIWKLSQSEFCYAYTMLRVGRLQDAQQYIDLWFNTWSVKPEAISDSFIMSCHATMMNLKARVLDAQGCTAQALLVTQKVRDIVKLSVSTHRRSFVEMIESMVREARLRVNLGDNEEAMQLAEESLRLSRDTEGEAIIDNLVWSLQAVAFTALSCGDYMRAIEAAQEGYHISASPKWQRNQDESDTCMHPSLFSILSYAKGNLGMCSIALEYGHRAVAMSLDIRDRKANISATTAEQSYMETRGNLADILLATGDVAQARQICEERIAYFIKRVEKHMGDYRELAPILRMHGILCCSEGRHEEGDAAAQELSRIMTTLCSAFPSLQEHVKIRLRNKAEVPILKVLEDMSQKLDCGHQTEILALFAI